MKITKIEVFQADLPLVDGKYVFADGKVVDKYDATIVAIHTDHEGIVGYGEITPIGGNYLASYANGVRTGLRELGPKILGQDPTKIGVINQLMDRELKGHPYVKSPIDMACWDILGKFTKLPVSTLLGGSHQESVRLYRAIGQTPPKEMAALVKKYKDQGYTAFQLKVGGAVEDDIERIKLSAEVLDKEDTLVCDANTGWLSHDALRIANAVKHLDVYIEQPCATQEECLVVRRNTHLPFVMDENVEDLHSLIDIWKNGAADVVNIKIAKFGGLSKAKKAIDLALTFGIAMCIEDTWGGDIVTAAILQLASTVPAKFQFTSTDFNAYNTVNTGIIKGTSRANGRMTVPKGPGLAVVPNFEVLGKPVFVIE